jgi:hypothetical protein
MIPPMQKYGLSTKQVWKVGISHNNFGDASPTLEIIGEALEG